MYVSLLHIQIWFKNQLTTAFIKKHDLPTTPFN